jgi:hypothetical protein
MSNLQKTLDALQPYVIGIRYVNGIPLVDVVFKDGWSVPNSDIISKVKGSEEVNYHMIYSEKEGIGIDELLEFVDTTIKINVEREKKQELLKQKVNDLKELFKKTSLTKLINLRFTISEDEFLNELNDFSLDNENKQKDDEPMGVDLEVANAQPTEPLTEEDREIIAEELKAEQYREYQEKINKNKNIENIKNKIELPPKNVEINTGQQCECGPNEACNKCIETKDL